MSIITIFNEIKVYGLLISRIEVNWIKIFRWDSFILKNKKEILIYLKSLNKFNNFEKIKKITIRKNINFKEYFK
jgi:hypothetical protein